MGPQRDKVCATINLMRPALDLRYMHASCNIPVVRCLPLKEDKTRQVYHLGALVRCRTSHCNTVDGCRMPIAHERRCVKRYLPTFGRIVIFSSTDFSYHGHPLPLSAPHGRARRSLALYYYTNGRPIEECVGHDCNHDHLTLWQMPAADCKCTSHRGIKSSRSRRVSTCSNPSMD